MAIPVINRTGRTVEIANDIVIGAAEAFYRSPRLRFRKCADSLNVMNRIEMVIDDLRRADWDGDMFRALKLSHEIVGLAILLAERVELDKKHEDERKEENHD